jgi:hypothetical protein
MAFWPSSVATNANLYVAVNSLQTTLSTGINSGDTSIILASATGFPVAGAVVIGNEVIFYTGVSGSTLTGCTRGADGTTAAAHSTGVPVGAAIVAFHHNGMKDEVIAIESYLDTVLGKGTSVTATEFAYVHGVTSAIQTQMDLKAPKASPTFTGTVVIPTPFTVGAVSVTATGTEMNYLVGVSSAIQTQLGLKATDSLVAHLAGAEVFTGAKTFQSSTLLLQEAGSTDVVTVAVASLAASRLYTVPDAGAAASFVMSEGASTLNAVRTFGSGIIGAAGAVGAVSFGVGGATNGIYLGGTNIVGVVTNGVERWIFDASGNLSANNHGGVIWAGPSNSATFPDHSFYGDTNSGLRSTGADALALTVGASDALTIDSSGRNKRPLQPCFLVTGNGSDQTNATGDGTVVTVVYGTESYDVGSNFASNTFTAPVTGKYLLVVNTKLGNLGTGHTTLRVSIVTTARTYFQIFDVASSPFTGMPFSIHVLADMSASDTAIVQVNVSGSTKTVTIVGAATQSFFSGTLIN